jgi:hypothetical protein
MVFPAHPLVIPGAKRRESQTALALADDTVIFGEVA